MEAVSTERRDAALGVVSRSIVNCRKMQGKFAEGTSHHSLLKNRIRALEIARCLLETGVAAACTAADLEAALPPIQSILHKTTKARSKYEAGSPTYKRFTPTVDAMLLCRALLEEELRGERLTTPGKGDTVTKDIEKL